MVTLQYMLYGQDQRVQLEPISSSLFVSSRPVKRLITFNPSQCFIPSHIKLQRKTLLLQVFFEFRFPSPVISVIRSISVFERSSNKVVHMYTKEETEENVPHLYIHIYRQQNAQLNRLYFVYYKFANYGYSRVKVFRINKMHRLYVHYKFTNYGYSWVNVFRIIHEFRILRASKC